MRTCAKDKPRFTDNKTPLPDYRRPAPEYRRTSNCGEMFRANTEEDAIDMLKKHVNLCRACKALGMAPPKKNPSLTRKAIVKEILWEALCIFMYPAGMFPDYLKWTKEKISYALFLKEYGRALCLGLLHAIPLLLVLIVTLPWMIMSLIWEIIDNIVYYIRSKQ